ncbi:MAG: hypothetical protein WDO15_24660 [Bacteroidota bacterium]
MNVNNSGVPNDVTGVLISYGRNLVGVNKDPNAQTYLPSGMPNYIQDYVGTAAAPVDPLGKCICRQRWTYTNDIYPTGEPCI